MRAVLVLTMVVSTVAMADADPKFAKLRDEAEPLGSISAFLDKYVGDCASKMMGGGECERSTANFRQGATGKKFYMIVTEETAGVLSMGEVKQRDGSFVLNFTPFFGASGMALSQGAPSKTDGNGNPIIPYIRIDSQLPENWSPAMMVRQVQAQALRLQIVFTPQGVWSLPKKGGGTMHGAKARIDAVLVTVGRTGDQVGLWVAK